MSKACKSIVKSMGGGKYIIKLEFQMWNSQLILITFSWSYYLLKCTIQMESRIFASLCDFLIFTFETGLYIEKKWERNLKLCST